MYMCIYIYIYMRIHTYMLCISLYIYIEREINIYVYPRSCMRMPACDRGIAHTYAQSPYQDYPY